MERVGPRREEYEVVMVFASDHQHQQGSHDRVEETCSSDHKSKGYGLTFVLLVCGCGLADVVMINDRFQVLRLINH